MPGPGARGLFRLRGPTEARTVPSPMSSRDAHHDHRTHDHWHRHGNFDRAIAIGIAPNLCFVVVEPGFGCWVNSLALLADAMHNLSNVAGLVLAQGGALVGRRRPDARHTCGWRRACILSAFLNTLPLVAIGSLGSGGRSAPARTRADQWPAHHGGRRDRHRCR